MGKLDPLLWLPADDLLIDGVNDILQFLSGEEVLLKRPEERLPWDGDLWLRPVPFDIWFQHVEMNTRAQSELKSLSTFPHVLTSSSSSSTKTKSEASCREAGDRGVAGVKRREWARVSECRGMGDKRLGS